MVPLVLTHTHCYRRVSLSAVLAAPREAQGGDKEENRHLRDGRLRGCRNVRIIPRMESRPKTTNNPKTLNPKSVAYLNKKRLSRVGMVIP